MFKNFNEMSVFLLVMFGLAAARIASKPALNAINLSDVNENDIDDEAPQCEQSVMPPEQNSMCCGIDVSTSNRIVGGEPTLINQYPWLAAIEYRVDKHYEIMCGGSLISGRYVLTAAHCFENDGTVAKNVVLGDYDITNNGYDCVEENDEQICADKEIRIGIKKIIRHEAYDSKLIKNDIALLKLETMAPYTEFIRPICLPSNDPNTMNKNLQLIITGWGYRKNNKMSDVKMHTLLPFVNHSKCNQTWNERGLPYGEKYEVNMEQICAGGVKMQSVCAGDSGGPLMIKNSDQYEVTGISSYSFVINICADNTVPQVFTNVYRYKKWILNKIHEEETKDKLIDKFENYLSELIVKLKEK